MALGPKSKHPERARQVHGTVLILLRNNTVSHLGHFIREGSTKTCRGAREGTEALFHPQREESRVTHEIGVPSTPLNIIYLVTKLSLKNMKRKINTRYNRDLSQQGVT